MKQPEWSRVFSNQISDHQNWGIGPLRVGKKREGNIFRICPCPLFVLVSTVVTVLLGKCTSYPCRPCDSFHPGSCKWPTNAVLELSADVARRAPRRPALRPHGARTHFRALLGHPEVRAARSRLAPARLEAGTTKFFPWVAPQTFRRPCSGFRSRAPTPRPLQWSLGQGHCQHPAVAAGAGLLNLFGAWEPSGFVTKPMEPFWNYILKSIKIG